MTRQQMIAEILRLDGEGENTQESLGNLRNSDLREILNDLQEA